MEKLVKIRQYDVFSWNFSFPATRSSDIAATCSQVSLFMAELEKIGTSVDNTKSSVEPVLKLKSCSELAAEASPNKKLDRFKLQEVYYVFEDNPLL